MTRTFGKCVGAMALIALCAACDRQGSKVDALSADTGMATVASSSVPSDEASISDAPGENATEDCGLELARSFVDRTDSPKIREALARAVGARPIRWIHPGEAVTQDYSLNRLNVMIDESDRITSLRCG